MSEVPHNADQFVGTRSINTWIGLLEELSRFYGANANFKFADTYVPRIMGRTPFLAPANTVLPAITGTAQVGSTLTASNGTWLDSGTITRQWLADGVAISGATSTTFVVTTAELDKKISVRVSNTNNRGTTTVVSAETAAVIAA